MDRDHIEAELDDGTNVLLRLLADVSLDEGDEEMSAGYLWLVDWNRHPLCEKRKGKWEWWWICMDPHELLSFRLPMRIDMRQTFHPTKHLAFRRAAKAVGAWYLEGMKAITDEVENKISE